MTPIRTAASLAWVLFTPSLLWTAVWPSFNETDFRRIVFTGACAEKQWSVSRNGRLEIVFAAEPGQTCQARLQLANAREVHQLIGMRFRVRGSRPRHNLTLELVGREGSEAGQSRVRRARTLPYIITDEWTSDGLRFRGLMPRVAFQTLSEIRLITRSERKRSPAVVTVRNLAFVGPLPTADAAPETPAPDALPPEPSADHAAPVSAAPPSAPAPFPDIPSPPSLAGYWPAGLAGIGLLGALLLRRRARPVTAPSLAPLYEINTRTWRSRRDKSGLLHIGGFESLTLADLKAIKASGFNSVWLMGVWEIGAKVRAISKTYGSDYSGSPFAIYDYRVSEDLGSEQDFDALVDRAHSAGLKVIIDFVPNHMGLDCAWLHQHPEYFLHRLPEPSELSLPDAELEKRYPGYFVYHTPAYPGPSGRREPRTILVAYGKDPYFFPWIDTAQLDYAEPALRRKMIDVLCAMAKRADGVRCDMAMLVLREQVKLHRHPDMAWESFNRRMPEEFWSEAIRSAKRANPAFLFIAETYWSMEGYLQQLGFDYTYNKPLYEAVCAAFHNGNAEGLMNFIRMLGTDFLSRGVHFLENHDEERAMNTLGEERQRAAAALLMTLPGAVLIHQGQMEGKRERLPVQRVVPLHREPENASLSAFYKGLLQSASRPVFRDGRLHVLYSNNPAFISYARIDQTSQALIVINTSNRHQKGSVFLSPGLRLKSRAPYILHDAFYEFKAPLVRQQPTVQPSYTYTAAQMANQGLYVELHPFDAHIFLFNAHPTFKIKDYVQHVLRGINQEWPLPRLARRVLGPALMRFTDTHDPVS